jgi:hypothetical protein
LNTLPKYQARTDGKAPGKILKPGCFSAIHDQPQYKITGVTNSGFFRSGTNLPSGYDINKEKVTKISKILKSELE